MTPDTVQAFGAGFLAGSLISGIVGFYYGRKLNKMMGRPEFRIVLATIITAIWAMAQLFSLAFGSEVDTYLNIIMGGVVGFFFGDGVLETLVKKSK